MNDARTTALIAIDWGTSSARAYRVANNGEVLEERHQPLGILHVQNGNFAAAFTSLLGDWTTLDVPRLACGMIGSRQGWIEAPYRTCPVALADLGRELTQTAGGEMGI